AGIGVGAWWYEAQRAHERERLAQDLRTIEKELDGTEQALRDDREQRAAEHLERAETQMAKSGGDHLRPRLEKCRNDLAMLRKLNEVYVFGWKWAEGIRPDWTPVVAKWNQVFAEYGIVPGVTE